MKPAAPWVLGSLGLLLGIAAIGIATQGATPEDLDRSLGEKARLLAERVEQNRLGELRFLGSPNSTVTFAVWRGDGQLVAGSPDALVAALSPVGAPVGELAFRSLPVGERPGRAAELTFVPRTAAGSEAPTSPLSATVVVAEPRPRSLATLAIVLGAATLAVFLLLPATLRIRGKPVEAAHQELARKLQGMDAGSLGEALDPAEWPAELKPTVDALNELFARLKKAFDRERGFAANLAHEIRTPLAELRTLAEVAFRWPEDDPEERARVFEEVYAIGLQMERIVDNLLAISRYETGHHALLTAPVVLAEAVRGAWRGVAAEAEKKGIQLELEIPADLVVTTDREKLALVLTNLLSNAVAHGEPGLVSCRGERQSDSFVLTLANPAQGLEAEDLARMFERKWRKDRGDRGRHSGLGLALVATLCRRLGFEVAARLPDPGHLEIRLSGSLAGHTGLTVRGPAPGRS